MEHVSNKRSRTSCLTTTSFAGNLDTGSCPERDAVIFVAHTLQNKTWLFLAASFKTHPSKKLAVACGIRNHCFVMVHAYEALKEKTCEMLPLYSGNMDYALQGMCKASGLRKAAFADNLNEARDQETVDGQALQNRAWLLQPESSAVHPRTQFGHRSSGRHQYQSATDPSCQQTACKLQGLVHILC